MNETRTLEFKETVTNTFLKTVSAFANFGTGEIRFGVRDDGSVKGVEDPERMKLELENKINDSIQPKPDYHFDFDNHNKILSLIVEEGPFKPYLYRGKAYRRSDTATIPCDQLELRRLILEGSDLTFDQLPSDDQKLTFHVLESKIREILGVQKLTEDIMKTLNLYTEKKGYNNAGALLSDNNDFSGIDMIRFGKSLDVIKDRITVKKVSVLEQYEEAVRMYQRYYQEEVIHGIAREKKERVPEKAFREAVANALVHRQWDMNADIHISMFEDYIEIVSVGGLPEGLSEEEYLKGGISVLRNPVLANVLFRLHYIESFGTGIRRIRDAYYESASKPEFDVQQNSIRIKLPVVLKKNTLTADEQLIADRLSEYGSMNSRQIADATGFSRDKTIRLLNRLIQKNGIKRTGNGRSTKYNAI